MINENKSKNAVAGCVTPASLANAIAPAMDVLAYDWKTQGGNISKFGTYNSTQYQCTSGTYGVYRTDFDSYND